MKEKLYSLMLRLVRDERGQDMVEYALLAGFIAVAAGAILPGISNNISIIFSKMASLVGNAAATQEAVSTYSTLAPRGRPAGMASARVVPDFPAREDPPNFHPSKSKHPPSWREKAVPCAATGLSVFSWRQFTSQGFRPDPPRRRVAQSCLVMKAALLKPDRSLQVIRMGM